MKFFSFFALLAFSGLASAEFDPKKQTISEVYSKVSPLREKLDHAVSVYKQHKYGVFARQALKYEYSPALSQWHIELHANHTYETSEVARMTYSELTLLSFVYPIISDPAKLSDALKIKALIYGLDKESKNDTTSPTFTELRESVQQIIGEENKMGRNWTKTNSVLDDLYDDLDVHDPEAFIATSGYLEFALDHLGHFCATEKDVHCPSELHEALIQFQRSNHGLHKLLPVDNTERMRTAIEVLERYLEEKDIIEKIASELHIDCDAAGCRLHSKHH